MRHEWARVLGYALRLNSQGLPVTQILVQTALHVGLRFGQGTTSTDELKQLLGRKATSLQTYVMDQAALWQPLNALAWQQAGIVTWTTDRVHCECRCGCPAPLPETARIVWPVLSDDSRFARFVPRPIL